MTDDLDTVRDDIAYVRTLAQEGRTTPLLNGPILIAAALIFGAANAGQYLLQAGVIAAGVWAPLWLWIGAAAVFGLALVVLIRRLDGAQGSQSALNRAVGAAWSGIGIGIFAVWLGLLGIGFTTGQWSIMAAMPVVVFAAYGSAWLVSGTMARSRWMTMTGLTAYAGAVLLGVTATSPFVYLVFAALLLGCALVPGMVLGRQAAAARAA